MRNGWGACFVPVLIIAFKEAYLRKLVAPVLSAEVIIPAQNGKISVQRNHTNYKVSLQRTAGRPGNCNSQLLSFFS